MAFRPVTRFRSLAGGGLFLVTIAMMSALPVAAAPLDKETCDRLTAEKQSLVMLGVEKDMAKGADWAKVNLKPAQLDMVKRYIAVGEQLKFRCRGAVVAAQPEAPEKPEKPEKPVKAALVKPGKPVAAKPEKAAQPVAAKQQPPKAVEKAPAAKSEPAADTVADPATEPTADTGKAEPAEQEQEQQD